jgi:branched-subunit amino acid ABC-type transport system permease component
MLQLLVNGLLLGSNYALLALGYTLVFGVMHLLTLAHGPIFMAAGLLALLLAGSTTPVAGDGAALLSPGWLSTADCRCRLHHRAGYRHSRQHPANTWFGDGRCHSFSTAPD